MVTVLLKIKLVWSETTKMQNNEISEVFENGDLSLPLLLTDMPISSYSTSQNCLANHAGASGCLVTIIL